MALSEFVEVHYEQPNKNGVTPFMAACRGDYLLQAQWLMTHQQVNINHVDTVRDNALTTAVKSRQADIFNYLLTQPQLELNHQDENEDTAYTLACEQGNIPFVCALINRGCHIGLKNVADETGFDILIHKNQWHEFFTVSYVANQHCDNPQRFISARNKAALALLMQQITPRQAVLASNSGIFAPQRLTIATNTDEATLQPPKRLKAEEDLHHPNPAPQA